MEKGVGNQTLYMTYASALEAKTAFNKLNNLKFDNAHKMSCIWVNELRDVIEEEEEQIGIDFKAPISTLTKEKAEHNLDEQLRSQFLVR